MFRTGVVWSPGTIRSWRCTPGTTGSARATSSPSCRRLKGSERTAPRGDQGHVVLSGRALPTQSEVIQGHIGRGQSMLLCVGGAPSAPPSKSVSGPSAAIFLATMPSPAAPCTWGVSTCVCQHAARSVEPARRGRGALGSSWRAAGAGHLHSRLDVGDWRDDDPPDRRAARRQPGHDRRPGGLCKTDPRSFESSENRTERNRGVAGGGSRTPSRP